MLGVSVVSCFIKGRARIVDVGASSEALTGGVCQRHHCVQMTQLGN